MVFWCLWFSAARAALLEQEAQLLWTAEGSSAEGTFGWAVSELGDIDGDGAMDAIVGSPFEANQVGRTHVLSGRSGETLLELYEPAQVLQGTAIADAGDTNGDGLPEILSGAPGRGAGAAFLYAADGALLLRWSGEAAQDNYGVSVSGAGDANGDGYSDVLVGADHADANGTDSGRAYVYSGSDGALLHTLEAASAGDLLGTGAGRMGDLDGDDREDLVLGAADASMGARGAVFVFSAADGAVLLGPLRGDPRGYDLGRYFVDGVGDINNDGVDDLYGGDFSENNATGAGYIFSGSDGAELLYLTGDYAGEGLGCGRGAGDVNGDGVPDLSLGAWQSNDGATGAGQVIVFSGVDGAVLHTFTSTNAGENFGYDAVGIGDATGDGAVDILVGAGTGDRVYLVSGPAPEEAMDTGMDEPPEEKRCGVVGGGGWVGLLAAFGAVARRIVKGVDCW